MLYIGLKFRVIYVHILKLLLFLSYPLIIALSTTDFILLLQYNSEASECELDVDCRDVNNLYMLTYANSIHLISMIWHA